MKKRCIALLMAVVAVVATGCGTKTPEPNAGVVDGGVIAEEQAQEEEKEFTYDIVLTDYEAKNTVTIGASDGYTIIYGETPVKVEVADEKFEYYERSSERNAEFHYWDGENITILQVQHSWNEVPEDLGHDIYVRNFEKDEEVLWKSFQYGDIDGCYQFFKNDSDPEDPIYELGIYENIGQSDYLFVHVMMPNGDYNAEDLLKEYLFKKAE